jgi:hypothetical protein
MPSLKFNDFSSGLWIPADGDSVDPQPGFAVPENALLVADNVEYLSSGGVRGRRGRTLRTASAIPNADEVVGLWRHYGRRGQLSSVKSPRIATTDGSYGVVDWANEVQTLAEDGVPATVTLPVDSQLSYYLRWRSFGFAVPADATITGIQVQVRRCQEGNASSGAVRDVRLKLSKTAGVLVGDNKASLFSNWPIDDYQWATYGGATDLWGTTWTPAEINAGAFAVYFSVGSTHGDEVAQVDCARVTVFYTTAEDYRHFLAAVTRSTFLEVWRENPVAAGSFTKLVQTKYAGYHPRFVYWPARNMTFIFCGGSTLYSYNGVVLEDVLGEVVADVTMTPRTGPHATLYKDRLYATDPNELNYSIYACDILDETIWRPEAHLNVSDPQGGRITGLEAWGDSLWIFKETSIWRWTGDVSLELGIGSLVQVSDRGCIAPATIQITPWGIIYLASDGLYAVTLDGDVALSAPIRPLFASRTTQSIYTSAIGVYHERREAYYLKLNPTADECYVLHRVRMPTTEGEAISLAWSRIPVLPVNAGCTWPGEQDKGEVFFGDRDGKIWEADVGSQDVGDPIATVIQTPFRALSTERVLGRAYEIEAIYRGTKALSGDLRYDQSVGSQVEVALGAAVVAPAFQYPLQTIVNQVQLGRTVSVKLENSADGPEYELHEINLSLHLRSRRR